jgi:hypothetical protein
MENSEFNFQKEDLKRFNIQIGNIGDDFTKTKEMNRPD